MTEQITGTTKLTEVAERAATGTAWWEENALDQPNALVLPTRVMTALDNAGITTVEQLKAAGPIKLQSLPHVGKQGFELIVAMLRALDRQNGGASNGHQQPAQTSLR
jgi:hypothetical protein